jgi:hypothetical protein
MMTTHNGAGSPFLKGSHPSRIERADERTRTAYPCSSYECAVSGC